MAPNDLILLTGATGFIGFATLLQALSSNYHVRCAVRDPQKASKLRSNPALTSLSQPPNHLTFTHVPDLTTPGAYNDAIKGAKYVIHVASPLPAANPDGYKDADNVFIRPAVRGALEMLEAAHRTPSVQKVVITSSVTALIPSAEWSAQAPATQTYGPESRIEPSSGPFTWNGPAYGASKAAQLQAVERWVESQKPGFEVVTVHPSWVLGRAELADKSQDLWAGTNRFLLDNAVGMSLPKRAGACVLVDDVARTHVLALEKQLQGREKTLVTSVPMRWEDLRGVLDREFPEAVKKGWLSLEGKQETQEIGIDGSETERVMGFKFRGFEELVRELVGQFVELKAREAGSGARV
ncbi:hypothetical protein MMC28_008776 [Mycoblastus sanguinarius]|nr:hypothetical protein [Mycoblastus sanguinarius]